MIVENMLYRCALISFVTLAYWQAGLASSLSRKRNYKTTTHNK